MIMAKILGTLQQKFSSLITAWDSVSEASQIQDNLIERLLTEENRLTNFEEAHWRIGGKTRERNGAAHDVNNSKKETQETKNTKHDKKDHTEKRCYKKHDDTENKREINSPTKDNTANFGAFI